MNYLNTTSLADTIDNVSEALLFSFDIAEKEKLEIADFLIGRHNIPGAYANMFAPTETDMKHELVLFTGEKIKTNAARRHMMGEEACRILRRLGVKNDKVEAVLKEADEGIQKRISESGEPSGKYCCKNCSSALWLNLSAGGINNNGEMLIAGLRFLRQHREEKGTWKGFNYFYTLYVLNEIEPGLAMDEMKFAAKSINRWIKRKPVNVDKYTLRRNFIGESILTKANLTR